MNVELLRQATRTDHEAIENAVPLMSSNLSLETYVSVLHRMHGLVAAWEQLAAKAAPEWMRPLLTLRERHSLLEQDLEVLAPELPLGSSPDLPPFLSEAQLLGAMYVMEGSRLGGLMIAKHVEQTLGFPTGQGDAYFRGSGKQTVPLWKEFVSVLQTRVPDEKSGDVILGARTMFHLFAAWMNGDAGEQLLTSSRRS